MENIEQWKEIPGLNGDYEISNYGRVKSVSRKHLFGKYSRRSLSETIIKLQMDSKGYYALFLPRRNYQKRIHRLVAELFNPNSYHYDTIHHKDGNKLNNHYLNLEWTTRGQNIKYHRQKSSIF